MDNLGYLVAAYVIIWLGLFGYLFWMGGVLRRVRGEVAELRARVAAEPEPAGSAAPMQPEAKAV